jgi:hypothetical protein
MVIRLRIEQSGSIARIAWHRKGDYLAAVAQNGISAACLCQNGA